VDKFVIEGPRRLEGAVDISGAKNAVLPVMAASLLSSGVSRIHNVPRLRDVLTMTRMLETLGLGVERRNGSLEIDAGEITRPEAPYELVRTMRASVYVLGPLLARRGRARVSLPGGCAWGPRPVDLHLFGMKSLGAEIELEHGYIIARAEQGLRGGRITFPISSVGATANTLMAAVLARGTTVLENAACEPEVGDLCRALVRAGARIEGEGSGTITIEGVDSIEPLDHSVIPDRIETGTFLCAAAMTGGRIELNGCEPDHLSVVLEMLRGVGCTIEHPEATRLVISGPEEIRAFELITSPYPGFPTDLQAQFMALASRGRGVSTITETIYPDRFTHVAELRRLGADIRLDGHIAVVRGVPRLEGAPVMATDIRASSALILAACRAQGTTEISRVYHIDRGYERIEERLCALGARITRVDEPYP
jgi:UDP-N-acetylglucosamine 1-carboxyvinyltransferase